MSTDRNRDSSSPLWERLNSVTLTTPSADGEVEKQELSVAAAGSAERGSHRGGTLTVSYESKHILTRKFSNRAPWGLTQWVKELCSRQRLHVVFYKLFYS